MLHFMHNVYYLFNMLHLNCKDSTVNAFNKMADVLFNKYI